MRKAIQTHDERILNTTKLRKEKLIHCEKKVGLLKVQKLPHQDLISSSQKLLESNETSLELDGEFFKEG